MIKYFQANHMLYLSHLPRISSYARYIGKDVMSIYLSTQAFERVAKYKY